MNPTDTRRPIKSYEWVMNDLKRQLDRGDLRAGDRLPSVVELAEQYGVGRSTIREALSALKAMGLLDIRQGGGTFVKEPPAAPPHPSRLAPDSWVDRAENLRHLLEVRRILESGCAALAALHRTKDDLRLLEETLAGMKANLHDEIYGEQADVRFHQQVAAATHNPVMMELMGSLAQKLHESMKDTRALWFYAERSSAERLLREHADIVEAIARQDAAQASARMEAHIVKVEQVLFEKSGSV